MLTDNFMEAYHHIAIHRDTLEPLLPARRSYALENDGPWSLLEATWAGLHSPCYHAGLLAPLEKPLWQFSQWWLERMGL